MSRKSAKTDILVDKFYPIEVVEKLAKDASEKTRHDSKKRYKTLTASFDVLNAFKLSRALDNVISQSDETNDKVTLTIYVDEQSTHEKLRMTVTAAKY